MTFLGISKKTRALKIGITSKYLKSYPRIRFITTGRNIPLMSWQKELYHLLLCLEQNLLILLPFKGSWMRVREEDISINKIWNRVKKINLRKIPRNFLWLCNIVLELLINSLCMPTHQLLVILLETLVRQKGPPGGLMSLESLEPLDEVQCSEEQRSRLSCFQEN